MGEDGKNIVKQKLREAFENTLENPDLKYEGSFADVDYFALFCKATAKDKLYKFLGLNVCMFNCVHNETESVVLIFSIPANDESSSKNIADKVMEIIELCEGCFTTVDYTDSKAVTDEKFIYVTVIKNVGKKNE